MGCALQGGKSLLVEFAHFLDHLERYFSNYEADFSLIFRVFDDGSGSWVVQNGCLKDTCVGSVLGEFKGVDVFVRFQVEAGLLSDLCVLITRR